MPTKLAEYLAEEGGAGAAAALAKKTGINPSLISRYASGRSIPEPANAWLIQKATKMAIPMEYWGRLQLAIMRAKRAKPAAK